MCSYRLMRRSAIASFLIVIATTALSSGIAAAPDGDDSVNHCTIGEVTSAFQAWVPGVKLWRGLGIDEGSLAEGVGLCQYRLYLDEAEVCFCEDDIFLAGVSFLEIPDPPDGPSQSEVREEIAAWETRIFITPDGGQESELDVMRTAIKDGRHDLWGHVVYQQHGVFLQLPPGDYLTRYSHRHPVYQAEWWEATVRVRILPHDTAHLLGAPSGAGFGSVQCPEE